MTSRIRPLKLVTGASRGIGAAIARAVAEPETELLLVGRDRERLLTVARDVEAEGATPSAELVDLLDRQRLLAWAEELAASRERLDLLVHSAGLFTRGPLEHASTGEIADLMEIHAGAPLILTRSLLPLLVRAGGTILFVNSTAALSPGPGLSAYTAAKSAQRALADSLRAEVAGLGVRVISAFVGRTATGMQERAHFLEGREYRPELLLRPDHLAESLARVIGAPAEITDITVRGPAPHHGTGS